MSNSNLPAGAENDPRAPFNEPEPTFCKYCDLFEIEDYAEKQMISKYGEDWQENMAAKKEHHVLANVDTLCDECAMDLYSEFKNDD